MHSTRIDLSLDKRTELVTLLNGPLAEAIDVHARAKHAHWNVKGPSFIALHELFDEIAGEFDGHADLLAERATSLGGVAEGRLAQVVRSSSIPVTDSDDHAGRAHLESLASALAAFGATVRGAIEQAEGLGDAGTADLFTEISRATDKSLWLIETHLQADA